MPFRIKPFMDQDKAIAILEELGVFGAVKKSDGSLRLYLRKKKMICPKTGAEIEYRPEELMTMDIRDHLIKKGWVVAHSSAWEWRGTFRG